MGKRGPKPKPKMIRLLEGNPSRRPLTPDDVEVISGLPPVKPSLVAMDEQASLEWDRVIASMPPGLYTAADVSALTLYATSWAMLHRAQLELDTHGVMVEERTTKYNDDGSEEVRIRYKSSPALAAWKTAAEHLWKAGDRLGLSPGVRSRLQLPKKEEAPASKFSGLLTTR